MAIVRFACEKYASLEMNRAAYLKNGLVVSQTPLGEAFTEAAPCENGMWVCADKAAGAINAPAAVTDIIGIVYTTEKEYSIESAGLKNFCQVAGEYPRVGVLQKGDTFTSNCFQYDTSVFADEAAIKTAVDAGTPVYVVPTVGAGAPTLVKAKPASGTYATVVKYYTMPNGEAGIKYNIVNA